MSLAALQDWQKLGLDEIVERLAKLPKDERDKLSKLANEFSTNRKWIPTAGPQMRAFFSPADVLLYGGEAAGGKSDLVLGLALTEHRRSLIIREQYNDLDALTERAKQINGTTRGYNGSNPPSLRTDDGRFIQFSGATMGQWQGHAFDLKCADEAAQVPKEVIRYHIGWIRSVVEGQRTRAVLATNPPTTPVGEYLVEMFRPWLDQTHPRPAEDGELRWYARDPDGDDVEVDGPDPILFPGQSRHIIPMSRTFIRARLVDNPYLVRTDYASRLDQMDEPYRSAMRDGKFMGARKDQSDQIIPAQWVREAQERWTRKPPVNVRMTAIGLDVGQGGADRVVAAPRYGTWYAPLQVAKGKDAPDGSTQAAFVARFRRDNAAVVVDVGGGYGGDVCSVFKSNSVPYLRFNGVDAALGKAKDGSGRGFENRRAEAWWRFREALNPDQAGGSEIALPADPELLYELTAPCIEPDKRAIQIENKKEIKKRLGRSIDKADAVVMAWAPGDSAARRKTMAQGGVLTLPNKANLGYSDIKRTG